MINDMNDYNNDKSYSKDDLCIQPNILPLFRLLFFLYVCNKCSEGLNPGGSMFLVGRSSGFMLS